MTTNGSIAGGIRAHAAAVRKLIAAHQDEWAQVYGDTREAAGLPRTPSNAGPTRAELEARIVKAEQRIEKYKALLSA